MSKLMGSKMRNLWPRETIPFPCRLCTVPRRSPRRGWSRDPGSAGASNRRAHRGNGLAIIAAAEDRGPGDEPLRTRLGYVTDVVYLHPAVDLAPEFPARP